MRKLIVLAHALIRDNRYFKHLGLDQNGYSDNAGPLVAKGNHRALITGILRPACAACVNSSIGRCYSAL